MARTAALYRRAQPTAMPTIDDSLALSLREETICLMLIGLGFVVLSIVALSALESDSRGPFRPTSKRRQDHFPNTASRVLHDRTNTPLIRVDIFLVALALGLGSIAVGVSSIVFRIFQSSTSIGFFISVTCLGLYIAYCLYPMVPLYRILFHQAFLKSTQPASQFWFDEGEKLSFDDFASVMSQRSILDQVKLWVQRRVRPLRVNWYPFYRPVKPLPYDSIRIRKVCVSSIWKYTYSERIWLT